MHEKRNRHHNKNKTMKKEYSRNAFKNSDFIKALEIIEEEVAKQDYYGEVADDDYYDDAPIINIRFKRDESSNTQKENSSNSILLERIQETF